MTEQLLPSFAPSDCKDLVDYLSTLEFVAYFTHVQTSVNGSRMGGGPEAPPRG